MSTSEEMLWVIRLVDQASRPAQAIRAAFADLTGTSKTAGSGVRDLASNLVGLQAAGKLNLGGQLGGFVSELAKGTDVLRATLSLQERLKGSDLSGTGLERWNQQLASGRSAVAATTDLLKGLTPPIDKADAATRNLGNDARTLGDRFRDVGTWIKAGLGIDIGQTIGRTIRGWIGDLVSAIPDAIAAGRAYAQSLNDIQDETGMTAQQTSVLVGLFERVGVGAGDLGRVFAMFGRNLVQNEDLFKRLGIATRDNNGHFLDAYTVIMNARRAFAEHGAALATTGAAQELFSRSGYKLLDFLRLSDDQVKVYTDDLARMGLILDEGTVAGAERFNRELNRAGQVVTGLQTTIFAALGPSLEHFVDAFASFVRDNLNQIVAFVTNVANFIMGVVGGLVGLDFSMKTTEQQVAAAGSAAGSSTSGWNSLESQQKANKTAADALTTSLEGQIKGIDRQIDAIRRRGEARAAANQREQLALDLERAQQQLADLRGNKPYLEGLSNAQQQLALQKHAQDIADARKAVDDARGGLADFNADQGDQAQISALERRKARFQEELAAHKKKVQEQAALETGLQGTTIALDNGLVAKSDSMFATITAAAQSWRDRGVAFAGDLRTAFSGLLDMILGPETKIYSAGLVMGTQRSGGLVGALGGVGEAFGTLGRMADTIRTAFRILTGVFEGFALMIGAKFDGFYRALQPLRDLLSGLAGTLDQVLGPLAVFFDLIYDFVASLPGFGALMGKRPGSAEGRASGGPVSAGTLYRVNEGPGQEEYFLPNVGGRIAPSAPGGGQPIVIYLTSRLHLDGRQVAEVVDRIFYDDAGNSPVPLSLAGIA